MTLTHPLIGEVSARGTVLDDRWNLICFRTEDIVNDGVGGEFVLSFTVNDSGSMALDNFRRTSLIPVIHRATGHEKRCDLRWTPLWSNSGASYTVYRALAGTGQFAALSPPTDAYGINSKFPAYSDFDVTNGTAYDYRVEALVNGNTYLSDIVSVTPRAETDDEFLAGVGIATGCFYWQTAYPYSGMGVFNGPTLFPGSSQSGGMRFSMTSLPVLVERGYLSREEAAERMRLAMRFLYYHTDRHHGIYGLVIDNRTGKRTTSSGRTFDTCDISETAFLMQGILTCRAYFNGTGPVETELRQLATDIYEGIDWTYALRESETDGTHLWWGQDADGNWTIPIAGYHESSISYLLSIGSPTHPIPTERWYDGWGPYVNGESIYGYRHWISKLERALFYDYMSFSAMDPRFRDDQGNYFDNARNVAFAHRQYHIENPGGYSNYSSNEWGQNAIVLPDTGYSHDRPVTSDSGNISPLGPLGMLPYAPEISIPAVRHLYDTYQHKIYNAFGFSFGYNYDRNDFATIVSSIDSQMLPAVIENHRSGLIWNVFMNNPEIHAVMEAVGMTRHSQAGLNLSIYDSADTGWASLPDFGSMTPATTETVSIPSKKWRNQEDYYGHRYTGFLKIDSPGDYTFTISGKNGTRLTVDGNVLIEKLTINRDTLSSNPVTLSAGLHPILLDCYKNSGGDWSLSYAGPGITERPIPVTALRRGLGNDAPEWFGGTQTTATVGDTLSVTLQSTDADGDPLTVQAQPLPSWLQLTDHGDGRCTLSGTPSSGEEGVSVITLQSSDGVHQSTKEYTITVNALEDYPPAFVTRPQAQPSLALIGYTCTLSASAVDDDGDAVSYAWQLLDGPAAATFPNGNTAASVDVLFDTPGSYTFEVTATANGKTARGRVYLDAQYKGTEAELMLDPEITDETHTTAATGDPDFVSYTKRVYLPIHSGSGAPGALHNFFRATKSATALTDERGFPVADGRITNIELTPALWDFSLYDWSNGSTRFGDASGEIKFTYAVEVETSSGTYRKQAEVNVLPASTEDAVKNALVADERWATAGGYLGAPPVDGIPMGEVSDIRFEGLAEILTTPTNTDDSQFRLDSHTVAITVFYAGSNELPTANAGADQFELDSDQLAGEDITLDGSGSLDNDGTLTYAWTRNGIQIATGETPTVRLPDGEHTIQLTVTDNGGAWATDSVSVRIVSPNGVLNNGDFSIGTPGPWMDPNWDVAYWTREDLGDPNIWLTDSATDSVIGTGNTALKARWNNILVYQEFGATPNESYILSVDAMIDRAGNRWRPELQLEWYDATNTRIGSTLVVAALDPDTVIVDAWTKISGTQTSPAQTVKGRLILVAPDSGNGGSYGRFFFDNASVSISQPPPQDAVPSVANAIADVTVAEDAADTTVDLTAVFTDSDDDDAAITKSVQANTDPSLLVATITGNTLTLDYQPDAHGSAIITIRATSGGQTVDYNFTVIVQPPSDLYLFVGGETGTVESGQPVPLVESYSINESSSVDDFNGDPYRASALHNITAQNVSWAREGDHVLKFYADGRNHGTAQDYSRRVELSNSPPSIAFSPGDERFYSLSFLPPQEVWDQATLFSTVISQWKQYGGGNPNAEIRLSNMGDYKLTIRSVHHWESEEDEGDLIGYAKPGQWNDLKYYVKHSESSDGAINVWLNGELAFEYSGPTLHKDDSGYFKFGMYTEIRDERTLYFDAVRIQDSINEPLEQWATDQAHLPTVTLTGPVDDTQPDSGSTITLTATASDPAGNKLGSPGSISQVEFFAGANSLGVDTTSPYSLAWVSPADGAHILTAVAKDADGNLTTSEEVNIHVGSKPPVVAFTAPEPLANFAVDEVVAITADASDPDGNVTRVEFLVDGQLVDTDTSRPYSTSWQPSTAGAYALTAIATDSDGKSTTSEPLNVTAGAVITTSSVEALEDASLHQGSPTSPANSSNVEIYGKSAVQIIGIFKFDLSSYLSALEIRDAKLRIYTASVMTEGTPLSVYRAGGDSWSEATVTWDNGPTRGDKITVQHVDQLGQYYEFDVTDYVAAKFVDSDQYITLWVEDDQLTQKAVEFNSHTRSNPPLLMVTTSSISTDPDTSRQAQSISFATLPTKEDSDESFLLAATASSGLPVSYASSDSNVATVSGNTVTIVGEGTTTITASQAGDATYLPASDVSQVLTVEAAPNEPNWPDVQTIWDDAISLGWEWYLLEWFGIFNSLKYPWVYHVDHGWLYFAGSDANNLWIWKSSHGWFWTSNESYPYVFLFDDMSWGWIAEDGFLFNYGTEEWENFSN